MIGYYAKHIGMKSGFIIGIDKSDNEHVIEECFTYAEAIGKVEDWNAPCNEGIYEDGHIRGKGHADGTCIACHKDHREEAAARAEAEIDTVILPW